MCSVSHGLISVLWRNVVSTGGNLRLGCPDGTAVVDLCSPGSGGMEGQSRQEDAEILTSSRESGLPSWGQTGLTLSG